MNEHERQRRLNNQISDALKSFVDNAQMRTTDFKQAWIDVPTPKAYLNAVVSWDKIQQVTGWRPEL